MQQKSVLFNVQKQKIKQTQIHLIQWMGTKQNFLKQHIPIQQKLIKNLQQSSQITMLRLRESASILRQQKQLQLFFCQRLQKSILNDQKRFPQSITGHSSKNIKKQPDQNKQKQPPIIVWSSNIDKVFTCMSNSNKKRIIDSQFFIKSIQKCEQDLTKQQQRYLTQVKKVIKSTQKLLQKIDNNEKQQDILVQNIRKQSKNKQRDGNFYLVQYKKLQMNVKSEFTTISQRGKQIFNLMKTILDNEKACSKKLKQILQTYFKSKNIIFKQNQFDQRLLGVMVVIEDNVAQSRKQYFDKFLLSQDQIQVIKTLVQQPNMNGTTPNLECIVRYLRLQQQDYFVKMNIRSKLQFMASNLAYKKWQKASIAQGWLITTYLPVTIYLTYDNTLSIISNNNNELIRKVNLHLARINKVQNGNLVFLEQIIKGFFSDSKQQYQLKFDDFDSLEEFMVFIENNNQQ